MLGRLYLMNLHTEWLHIADCGISAVSGCQTNPKPRHGTCGLDFFAAVGFTGCNRRRRHGGWVGPRPPCQRATYGGTGVWRLRAGSDDPRTTSSQVNWPRWQCRDWYMMNGVIDCSCWPLPLPLLLMVLAMATSSTVHYCWTAIHQAIGVRVSITFRAE